MLLLHLIQLLLLHFRLYFINHFYIWWLSAIPCVFSCIRSKVEGSVPLSKCGSCGNSTTCCCYTSYSYSCCISDYTLSIIFIFDDLVQFHVSPAVSEVRSRGASHCPSVAAVAIALHAVATPHTATPAAFPIILYQSFLYLMT